MAEHPASYDAFIRTVHWLTLALIGGIYAAAWIAHSGLTGDWYQPVMQLHRSLGLSVAALTVARLAWRICAQIPALPSDLHQLQKFAARANEVLLYLLLLTQPVIGLLMTNARGQPVSFFLLFDIPPVIGFDRPLGKQLHGIHELTANVLLGAIGAHAAAALFHHFIRRDEVLNAMLPARLRGVGRSLFALRKAREQS
jgi:cytochrome b561